MKQKKEKKNSFIYCTQQEFDQSNDLLQAIVSSDKEKNYLQACSSFFAKKNTPYSQLIVKLITILEKAEANDHKTSHSLLKSLFLNDLSYIKSIKPTIIKLKEILQNSSNKNISQKERSNILNKILFLHTTHTLLSYFVSIVTLYAYKQNPSKDDSIINEIESFLEKYGPNLKAAAKLWGKK